MGQQRLYKRMFYELEEHRECEDAENIYIDGQDGGFNDQMALLVSIFHAILHV